MEEMKDRKWLYALEAAGVDNRVGQEVLEDMFIIDLIEYDAVTAYEHSANLKLLAELKKTKPGDKNDEVIPTMDKD